MNSLDPNASEQMDITPKGTCCFCCGLKPGVITVAIITIVVSLVSAVMNRSIITMLFTVAFILVNIFGFYCIYSNSYNVMLIYAVIFGLVEVANIVSSIVVSVLVSTALDCSVSQAPDRCNTIKTGMVVAVIIISLLQAYCVYVVSEYTHKLRKNILEKAQKENMA